MKIFLLSMLILGTSSMHAQRVTLPALSSPPASLVLFGEGSISTAINERDFAISPDGKEIYYTISTPKSSFQTIVFCKQEKPNKWTPPVVVSFAGKFSDLEPTLSADGQTLYFASNRPVTGTEPKDFDIWKVVRTPTGWGEPVNLGLPINTGSDEFYPSVASNGNLYYTATYKEGPGREDIYLSEFKDKTFQTPVALDSAVNSKFYEFNAFVDPDEQYIIFTSYGRKDDTGGGDLYMSTKDSKGKWRPAKNLESINSRQLDYCPYVSPDGKSLFMTSDRHQLPVSFIETRASYKVIQNSWSAPLSGAGNIYWIDFESVIRKYR